jgi:hypothetical protein
MKNAQFIDQEIHNGYDSYKWKVITDKELYYYETAKTQPLDRITIAVYDSKGNSVSSYPQRLDPPNLYIPCNGKADYCPWIECASKRNPKMHSS